MLHLFDCRYASNTINNYLAGLTHFAHWISQRNIDVKSIDEKLIQQFFDDHLSRCNCEKPVFHEAKDLNAAFGHLLVLLHANATITDPLIGLTPVDEELQRFDDHMSHVRGLAPSTRKINLCFIRRLLFGQFGDQAVVISAILPDHIRQFVANQGKLCKVTTSISAPIFRSHGPAWRYAQHDHLSLGQLKVMSAIEQCRTATLGGHLLCCPACDHHEIACNSCRNRLCTSLKN